MNHFRLDARLENDSLDVGMLELCQVRLMNDARWPWLLLVPQTADAVEIHDLELDQQRLLAEETFLAGAALKRATGCEKINTAALGNIVRQLHVHVVARSAGDATWPGPVWGFGVRQPYDNPEGMIEKIKSEFGAQIL